MGIAGLAQAQNDLAITDTTGYLKSAYQKTTNIFYQGVAQQTEGGPVLAYWPASQLGFENSLDFFYDPPTKGSRATRQTVKVSELTSLTVHGRYFERIPSSVRGLHVMAMRVVDGPIELFLYAKPGVVPIPFLFNIASANTLVFGALFVDAYTNNQWYLRENAGDFVKVRRSHFVEQMSAYVSDDETLAQKIVAAEKEFKYSDMISIITAYNQHLAAKRQVQN